MSRRDRSAPETLQEWQRRKKAQDDKDMRWLMSTAQGRRVLYRIVYEVAELESVNFSFQDARLRFSEGMRSVGQRLLIEAKNLSNPDVVHMWSEASSARHVGALHVQGAEAEPDEWEQKPEPPA